MARTATFAVRGEYYRKENVESIGIPNHDYNLKDAELLEKYPDGSTIYQYTFKIDTVELIPEPNNKVDPDAIKVIMNGAHVGYVAQESTEKVRGYWDSGEIEKITGTMKGAACKYTTTSSSSGKRYVGRCKPNYEGHFTLTLKAKEKAEVKAAAAGASGCCLLPTLAFILTGFMAVNLIKKR